MENITTTSLERQGFERVKLLEQGRVVLAYHRANLILYLCDNSLWYVQTMFDYPSILPNPVTTHEQLNELLKSIE